MKVHENAQRVAAVTVKITESVAKEKNISPEYLQEYRTRRILETMCDWYRDEPYKAFGRKVAPCYERCSLMHGNPECKRNWAD